MVSTLRSQRLTARAVAWDIITGEICSRYLFIVDIDGYGWLFSMRDARMKQPLPSETSLTLY